MSCLRSNILWVLLISPLIQSIWLSVRNPPAMRQLVPPRSMFMTQAGNNHLLSQVQVDPSLYKVASANGVHNLTFEVAGKTMSFETGKIGRQAGGSVVARTGDTMVYSTVCAEREAKPVDFTPLRVDYFARYSAVGQTTGSFHRRDSRGDDTEILVARLIDRPLRPMIVDGWQHETQVLAWLLSYDKTHPAEALAICAASAAMCVSEVPMLKPVAGVEVGLVNGTLTVNPTKQEMAQSPLHLTLAGTREGVLMIEGLSDFLEESTMVRALTLGLKHDLHKRHCLCSNPYSRPSLPVYLSQAISEICDALIVFQSLAGKTKKTDTLRIAPVGLVDKMDKMFGSDLTAALSIGDKHKRGEAVGGVETRIVKAFSVGPLKPTSSATASSLTDISLQLADTTALVVPGADAAPADIEELVDVEESIMLPVEVESLSAITEEDEASELTAALNGNIALKTRAGSDTLTADGKAFDPIDIKVAQKKLLVRKLRQMILSTGLRSDGRTVEEVRPLSIETGLLPRAHGSCLFTRGETQSLATATLGSKAMEAKFETVDESGGKRFYLQYRFPPSSVGEVGRVGIVNRREVGHGNLAERALSPALPDLGDFPYVVRAESLITESCGSSSMATVCSCSLAMLDAGVPLTTAVAGVAMGLILGENPGDEPVILTDILGLEDALGTMDFKIAGNASGITTFQLDIKSDGLTLATLEQALAQARTGRLHILQQMDRVLSKPNKIKDSVPKILEFKVPPEAIGKIIGPKGKTIQMTQETYSVTAIHIEDDGSVQIQSFSNESNEACKEFMLKLVEDMAKGGDRDKRRGDREIGEGEKKAPVELGPPPELNEVYRECEIKSVHNFGVFVEVLPGYEGLVHVSELDNKRVESPEKAGFATGGKIDVKFIGKNEKGQMRLSRRAVLLRDSPPNATGGLLYGGAVAVTVTAAGGAAAGNLSTSGPKWKSAVAGAEAAYNS